MEKLAELKSKFLKFLPRQPVASIHKSSLSPSGSVVGNRSPCRHIVSIVPKEARRKLRNSSFSAREPSSPKVSCMGEVDQLMKRRRKKKKKKKIKDRKHQNSDEKSDKKEKMFPWIFNGSGDDHHHCEINQRNSGKALDLELVEKEKGQRYTHSVPSLAKMKKFASGRGTLVDFDVKLAQISTGWTTVMATTQGKSLLCFLHIEGRFLVSGGGDMTYIGGRVRSRTIKEGTTYEEFKALVSSILGKDSAGLVMKFTLTFDRTTFVDILDDEAIEHLINFSGESGHVYVDGGQIEDDNITTIRDDQYVFDNFPEGLDRGSGTMCIEDSTSLPCAIEMTPAARPEMNSIKWKDVIIGKGQVFANADSLRQTLYKFSIANKFGYRFVKNNQQKIIVKCTVDGCPWYLGAYSMGERQDTQFLTIRTFKGDHIHAAQDNLLVPRMNRSKLTSSVIVDDLRCNIDKNANEIMRDMYREYGVRLNYSQAFRGKERALTELLGCVEDSYMTIPWICDRLVETDPDTVARCEFSESDRFERVFIAYGCSIKGFLQGCRGILYIDGSHLSGPYKGTLLSANAHDADDQLFPLAYAIVSGETHDDWYWFLKTLKDIIGTREITIVSDRNVAIISAVCGTFGSQRHAFCYRHVKENFSAQVVKLSKGRGRTSANNKEDALNMLDAIAYARHEHEYNVALGRLTMFSPQLAQWVQTEGDVERWAQSKFPHKRWDKLTTNIAESFNAWVLKERKHNVDVFINEHRQKLANKMVSCETAMINWKNGIGPNIESKLMEQVSRAENLECQHYGDNMISVSTLCNNRVCNLNVDLTAKTCTCLAWQMSGIPCSHACAAIKLVHRSVYSYVDDCYTLCSQQKIYANRMRPVATHDCPRPESLTVTQLMTHNFLLPPITRRPPGRPKKRRIESQFQNKRVYHCGRCNEAGHTIKTCSNPNPS